MRKQRSLLSSFTLAFVIIAQSFSVLRPANEFLNKEQNYRCLTYDHGTDLIADTALI